MYLLGLLKIAAITIPFSKRKRKGLRTDTCGAPRYDNKSRLEIDVGVVVAGLEDLLEVGSLGLTRVLGRAGVGLGVRSDLGQLGEELLLGAFVLPAAGGRVPRERRNLRGRAYLKKEGMPQNTAEHRDEKDANSTF